MTFFLICINLNVFLVVDGFFLGILHELQRRIETSQPFFTLLDMRIMTLGWNCQGLMQRISKHIVANLTQDFFFKKQWPSSYGADKS